MYILKSKESQLLLENGSENNALRKDRPNLRFYVTLRDFLWAQENVVSGFSVSLYGPMNLRNRSHFQQFLRLMHLDVMSICHFTLKLFSFLHFLEMRKVLTLLSITPWIILCNLENIPIENAVSETLFLEKINFGNRFFIGGCFFKIHIDFCLALS